MSNLGHQLPLPPHPPPAPQIIPIEAEKEEENRHYPLWQRNFSSFHPNKFVMMLPHEHLPGPFRTMASYVLLENAQNADQLLMTAIVILVTLLIVQQHVFRRPHPVPLKKLPKKPILGILFQPDDITTTKIISAAARNDPKRQQAAAPKHKRNRTKKEESFSSSTTTDEAGAAATARGFRAAAAAEDDVSLFFLSPSKWIKKSSNIRQAARSSMNTMTQRLFPHATAEAEPGLPSPPPPTNSAVNTPQRSTTVAAAASSVAATPTQGSTTLHVETVEDDEDSIAIGTSQSRNGFREALEGDDGIIYDEDHTSSSNLDNPHNHKDMSSASSAYPNTETTASVSSSTVPEPTSFSHKTKMDLPDSFAPLLSSSQMEVLYNQLTADLIHAVQVEASVRMRPGRYEIPLNKHDIDRPQFVLNVPQLTGCKMSVTAEVGSHDWLPEEDLDVSQPTTKRTTPMVKQAQIALDPALPIANVAPTLIRLPTLFEDKMVPRMKRNPILGVFINFFIGISSFIEKCLWIIESQLKIHLGKVRIVPIYNGLKKKKRKVVDVSESTAPNNKSSTVYELVPDWRLSLSFSGHVLLFGVIPIPFLSVTLPTFVIPQPHALLKNLMSRQPLASARLKRENIDDQKVALAVIQTVESWSTDVKVVATPPALGVEVILAGGLSVSVEMGLGRDPQAGRNRSVAEYTEPRVAATKSPNSRNGTDQSVGGSSWGGPGSHRHNRHAPGSASGHRRLHSIQPTADTFDANLHVPWELIFSAKGTISHDKWSMHILKCTANYDGIEHGIRVQSHFSARGSFAIWLPQQLPPHELASANNESSIGDLSGAVGADNIVGGPGTVTKWRVPPYSGKNKIANSFGQRCTMMTEEDQPSVAQLLIFAEDSFTYQESQRMLAYDYALDVSDQSSIDALTLTIGASHPMLNGGTMVTVILESLYAFGSFAAREGAMVDPSKMNKKREILRHLPAMDFTFGIHSINIPPESGSYSDDGLTLFVPSVSGGRTKIRLVGGVDGPDEGSLSSNNISILTPGDNVSEGIKLVADFEVPTLLLRTEGKVKEFPELEIFEGSKLRTMLNGVVVGCVRAHLRPQEWVGPVSSTGPNIFNPLEAYEIEFSGTTMSVNLKEFTASLGHRRIIFPSETSLSIKVSESVVDMGFEGKTECELSWDFQGLSPILQVTTPGTTPATVVSENKEQASLLIPPLRQGRFSLKVSPVGGITITKAATSREDKEGLYDWKFFNAIVSPDSDSQKRILDVLHDKRTMEKLLQVTKLINADLHRVLRYALKQAWRAKEILDSEGVSDPKHMIPMYKMSRLICLFLTGETERVDTILPIVRRVVDGDGLDVIKVKELLREHVTEYDEWAPEIDRLMRFVALALGPMQVVNPFVEEKVVPLTEQATYSAKFRNIPSASQLYEAVTNRPGLPLDPSFSQLVSQLAPYLTFHQVKFFLEMRASTDWQSADLRRIRYVYSIKRKVGEIAESYGGLSFLPQSFLVSVFLGEATRTSHRAASKFRKKGKNRDEYGRSTHHGGHGSSRTLARKRKQSAESLLRRRSKSDLRNLDGISPVTEYYGALTPAERVASLVTLSEAQKTFKRPEDMVVELESKPLDDDIYELGDSLLGPQDVAVLLQAGLTSVLKSSTVVQLNQRMLLDLICSQPTSFAIAVLSEIGSPSGQGSPRSLTSALMALLELDQTAFKPQHQIDMHSLMESWLPGLTIPRREDYMAGGRWARQSYYEAVSAVAKSILEDAECYVALKLHLQRVRKHSEYDPIPQPKEIPKSTDESVDDSSDGDSLGASRVKDAVKSAKDLIEAADEAGRAAMLFLLDSEDMAKQSDSYKRAYKLYNESFDACAKVLALDKHAFHAPWFRSYYKRNYDALMIKSVYDNLVADVDKTRHWLQSLRKGYLKKEMAAGEIDNDLSIDDDDLFMKPEDSSEQLLIEAIIDTTIFEKADREMLKADPLVRLLIDNRPGKYDFTIVTAMGVITEGKKGLELAGAFKRLLDKRGVEVVRADTGTARSWEYNAAKIEEAIEEAVKLGSPYGYMGYSQGCANAMLAETMLLAGTPKQQKCITGENGGVGLVCRQLLFSASNGSFHGPTLEKKVMRLIVMTEEFFKYQQGYFSRAFSTLVLEALNDVLDSAEFHKAMGGAQSFLPEGLRHFWREAQHVAHVPTCTLKGVEEEFSTPESLEMLSNLLTKQSGSPLHDSQVHVYDAVGYPVYHRNRNARILKSCAVGEGAVQRTHHWSPLAEEVEFVQTKKDIEMGSFDCAKDRHVFPWVDVNVRFGFIKYRVEKTFMPRYRIADAHPQMLLKGKTSTPFQTAEKLKKSSSRSSKSSRTQKQRGGGPPATSSNNPTPDLKPFWASFSSL